MAEERPVLSIKAAMEQNAEFFGFDLCDRIRISDAEVLDIYYRELLDAPTKKRVEQVYSDYEHCDRHDVEYTDTEGNKQTIKGPFKEPREKDGEIFDLDEHVSVALWGQEQYDRFIAAGGPPGLVRLTWERMRRQIEKRAASDSKSS
jgi:hypothetical protein